MALFKRSASKFWWMKFTFEGKLIQESTRETNRRKAENIEAAKRTKLNLEKYGIVEPVEETVKEVPTLEQSCNDFLAKVKVEHPGKTETFVRYARNMKVFQDFFGCVKVDEITAEQVEQFKIHRATKPSKRTGRLLKPITVNHELLTLRMVFNRLVDFDILLKNPARKVKLLDVVNSKIKILSVDEQKKYLLAAGQPLRDVAVLMVELGMRPSEILHLKRSDISLDGGFLDIREGKTKNAARRLPLSNASRKVLEYRLSSEQDELLFPGVKVVQLDNWHQKALKVLGIEKFSKDYFVLYNLRHCFASRHTENQTDMITLSELLGHGDLKTLKRYAHPSFEHKVSAIKRVEESKTKAV